MHHLYKMHLTFFDLLRMYEECMTSSNLGITAKEMETSKDKYFAKWVRDYVSGLKI